jgi:transcriptional regulator with XRE-family HTH domain
MVRRKKLRKISELPSSIIDRLGMVPDQVLADELGVSHQRVQQIRLKLGVVSHREMIERKLEEQKDRLGKFSDKEIAEEIGCHPSGVASFRRSLKIPSYETLQHEELVRQIRPYLGARSDPWIAREFGSTAATILHIRVGLGIPPFREKHQRIPLDKIVGMILEGKTDEEVSLVCSCHILKVSEIRNRLGIKKKHVCLMPRTGWQLGDPNPPEEIAPLIDEVQRLLQEGRSSSEVAALVGVPFHAVSTIRNQLGLTKRHIPDEIFENMVSMGSSASDIAYFFEMNATTVRRRLRQIRDRKSLEGGACEARLRPVRTPRLS